jgi:hypothetical protein
VLVSVSLNAQEQGKYFSKKLYKETPLPVFAELKNQLPGPVFDEDSNFIKHYWKAWELASRNFYAPTPENDFVSQYIDASFNANTFLWDGCFMTMFCNYAYPLVPGICSLDNFYAKQHETGEICREIVRSTGKDYAPWVNIENKPLFSRYGNEYAGQPWSVQYKNRDIPQPNPVLTLDALNHPILAWAELESYKVTGNSERLKMVYEPLVHYYGALRKYLLQGNGLYMTDWAGMDNSPRNSYIACGGTAVDISAEMVLFARNLSEIASLLRKGSEMKQYQQEAQEMANTINQKMWDSEKSFYYDLTLTDKFVPIKTIGSFWTLLAQVASKEQADLLVRELENPATFNRKHRVPTLAADQDKFDPLGGYWCGSVWAPTNTMVIRGLEKYGYDSLAYIIAMNHLSNVTDIFRKTGTIWENYAADSLIHGNQAKSDFVGWSGIAPILYFIEYAIGLKPDAGENTLLWNVRSTKRCGMENFRFNSHITSLIAEPSSNQLKIKVISDGQFNLVVNYHGITKKTIIHTGENIVIIQPKDYKN